MSGSSGRAALAIACLAVAGIAGSCGSDGGSEDERTQRIDLVVGDIVPLTGPDAGLGVSAQKAAQLAVEEVNDAIGEADVVHTAEIVHQNETARGASAAATSLLDSGANCILGPWSPRAMAELVRMPALRSEATLISPRAPAPPGPTGAGVVELPPAGPEEALTSDKAQGVDRDPSASYAQLYASTDPPIGPARTGDARQFDAAILCYLAAVATGPGPISGLSLGPAPARARPYSWLDLGEAIEALEQRVPIVYAGITVRLGILPLAGEAPPAFL